MVLINGVIDILLKCIYLYVPTSLHSSTWVQLTDDFELTFCITVLLYTCGKDFMRSRAEIRYHAVPFLTQLSCASIIVIRSLEIGIPYTVNRIPPYFLLRQIPFSSISVLFHNSVFSIPPYSIFLPFPYSYYAFLPIPPHSVIVRIPLCSVLLLIQ